tara:strand:+ start:188 stop:580 length:393 start_codon:yes stop_codon:yes gene_type:complete
MANPNIVNVTSIYGQSMGEALSTTLTTDIMTCQSNKLLKINFIQVTNTHATASTDVTVAVTKVAYTSGGIADAEDNAGTFALASAVTLNTDGVLVVLDKPIYLMEGDQLEAGANPATADIFVSFEVLDDA